MIAHLALFTLGFRLFLDPLPVDRYWVVLLLPLVLSISVTWKTIRLDDLRRLPGQSVLMTTQIIFFLVLAAAILWVVTALA